MPGCDDTKADAPKEFTEFDQRVFSPMEAVFHEIPVVHLQKIVIDGRSYTFSQEQMQAQVQLRLVGNGEIDQAAFAHNSQQLLQERNRIKVEVLHRLPANHPVEPVGFEGQPIRSRIPIAKNLEQVAVSCLNPVSAVNFSELDQFGAFAVEDRDPFGNGL